MITIVFAGAPLSAAPAAEWSVEGRADARFESDDNIRLRTTNEDEALGTVFSPEANLRGRSEQWDVTLKTKLDFARFTEDTLDRNDQLFKLNSNYLTERSAWSLEGQVIRDTTLTSELTDSGIVDDNDRRELYSVGPSWSHALSLRDSVTLAAAWTEVDYHTDRLSDYRYLLGSAGWKRKLSEVHELDTTAFTTHFEAFGDSDLERDMYAGQVGIGWIFSERFQARVAGGPRYVVTDLSGSESDGSFGFILDASVAYQWDERTALEVGAMRSLEPSALGTTLERDTLRLSVDHELSPRIHLGFEGLYLQNDETDEAVERDRQYYSLQPRIRWRLAQDWDLTAAYRFRAQRSGSDAPWADSNAILMTVTYRTPKWVIGH